MRAASGSLGCALGAAGRAGAAVTSRQPSLGMFTARLDLPGASALRRSPCVVAVTADTSVTLTGARWSRPAEVGDIALQNDLLGADDFWRAGHTGAGIGVALLDSGVAPVRGLDSAGKVVLGPDLSFESQQEQTRNIDTFGHGTHMAGIIAGRDPDAVAPYAGGPAFTGVAPDAHLVSLKLADARGATDVSQVVAAIDWVVAHRNDPGLNIRVLNLSYGTDARQDMRLDPLSFAAEVAWRKGIVVVTAAGNRGESDPRGGLSNPAYNPVVLAVGAGTNRGTVSTRDDAVLGFSSRGTGRRGLGARNPDLVAPGESIVSLRVPESSIDQEAATSRVGERFLRGSGTSQAAAFTSGAAALLLSQRPELTPDQVKAVLTGSAFPMARQMRPDASGQGFLNLSAALSQLAPPSALAQPPSGATGAGSLDQSRGTERITADGVELRGEIDIFGNPFDSLDHAARALSETAWSGGDWNGSTWAGTGWSETGWWGGPWTGLSWAGHTWRGHTWGGQSWAGHTWRALTWQGQTWKGQSWSGEDWVVTADDGGELQAGCAPGASVGGCWGAAAWG